VELSWSTFVLEIINFLVLVWILKHFLYKPVMDVIARRRGEIEKTRTEAAQLKADAQQLQKQYEGRVDEWNAERERAREALSRELDAERTRRLEALQTEVQKKKEQAQVADERRRRDELQKIEETAMTQSAQFASRLLARVAGPETEKRLVQFVVDELSHLPSERVQRLRVRHGAVPDEVVVVSVFELGGDERSALAQAIAALLGQKPALRFERDAALLAGVRIRIGAWVLGFNLADELNGLSQLANEDRDVD